MTLTEPDWWSIFRALDEPVTPVQGIRLESVLRPVDGAPGQVVVDEAMALSMLSARNERVAQGDGGDLEVPRNFDHAAAQGRFDRLAERLSEAYGCPCAAGLAQDSACYGSIRIPAEASYSRTKRTRIPLPLCVSVSKFGGLATYGPSTPSGQRSCVHPADRQRIEEALAGFGYVIVPEHVLATPYDGPNGWVFGPRTSATWFTRFFGFL